MPDRMNVLILCTGNSARSILGEAILRAEGGGRVAAFSGGSDPADAPNPVALEVLAAHGIDPAFAHSKSWEAFAFPGSVEMDYIFTVCDQAAGEVCPIWPGHPVNAHWGMPDPAHAGATHAERTEAFEAAWDVLTHRVRAFLALPPGALPPADEARRLREIGTELPEGFAWPASMAP